MEETCETEMIREKEDRDEKPSFDFVFIDSIVPHLRYEALVKLCLGCAKVGRYINRRWFHAWFRAAMRYIEDGCGGVPTDAGTVEVEQLSGPQTLAPMIDAGSVSLSDWTALGGDAGLPLKARFSIGINLLYQRPSCSRKKDYVFSILWKPLVVGIVRPQSFTLVLRDGRIFATLDERSQRDNGAGKTSIHVPATADECFEYRAFQLHALSCRIIENRTERIESKASSSALRKAVNALPCSSHIRLEASFAL